MIMTTGFDVQEPLANLGFVRSDATPKPAGVKLRPEAKPAKSAPPRRPSEPKTF
jgi:hypothetical protein